MSLSYLVIAKYWLKIVNLSCQVVLSTAVVVYNIPLESFHSNVVVENDFRKEPCVRVMKNFAIFLLSK